MVDGSWIEKVIRQGIESGALEPTSGVGEPIEDLDRPYDPSWWVRRWVEREQLDDLGREAGEGDGAGR